MGAATNVMSLYGRTPARLGPIIGSCEELAQTFVHSAVSAGQGNEVKRKIASGADSIATPSKNELLRQQ